MSDPFIGQIMEVGFNFPPRGWAHCDGQLLAISSNTALFSLLGTTFGGDGRSTFGLPDLRGRSSIHVGTGPGLSPVTWGNRFGRETNTQVPAHTHTVAPGCVAAPGDESNPAGSLPAISAGGAGDVYSGDAATAAMTATTSSSTGAAGGVDNRPPSLGIYHCIALTGIFPSRN